MSENKLLPAGKSKKLRAGLLAFAGLALVVTGVLAQNWFPLANRLTSSLVPSENESPNLSTPPEPPRLIKEYVHLGSELLAVVDAGAELFGPADLAVWRPSSGTWWVMGGSAGSQPAVQSWGLSTDKPVPGDYDGDDKTDFSVFRPSTGEWYVLRTTDSAWSVWSWGLSTDVRVAGDFDGDGKTDRAVWRGSNGTWYIVRSSDGSTVYHNYGISGDVPAPADYDGDGRADITVWRGSQRKFYTIRSSTGGSDVVAVGQSGGQPVSGDYDGDGRADYAVRNGATWTIRSSSSGTTATVTWQQATDVSVQNDYDGDGKVDIAVWRPNDTPAGTLGNWFIRQSGHGFALRQVHWGTTGDIPVPAFYRR